jgi:hypothetical protein
MNIITTLINKLRKKAKPAWISGSTRDSIMTSGTSSYVDMRDLVQMTTVSETKKIDERIEKKPVEVFQEIISPLKPVVRLAGLENQIKMVERRRDFIKLNFNNLSTSDEDEALVYLKARQKYLKNQDAFPWPIVLVQAVTDLCAKYKLREVGFESYYKNVPMEAIDELEKFIAAWKKIRSDEPRFRLIIDEGGKETKKDPILLAMSPFGKWFHMLGAWDKEVEYVDDIVYKGK